MDVFRDKSHYLSLKEVYNEIRREEMRRKLIIKSYTPVYKGKGKKTKAKVCSL